MNEGDEGDTGTRSGTVSSRTSCTGRRSLVSAVSTESGIHMGSDMDTAATLGQGPGPELLMQSKRLSKIIKNVKRSHSYNVSDMNKTNVKHRREAELRPKSLVHGWEDSAISIEELYLWQSQLKQLHMFNKNSHSVEQITKTKLPKKESLREKAKTLIRGLKTKRKTKDSSVSSFGTDDEPDSTSSLDRSSTSAINWTSKEPITPPDILRILKVFAGPGLRTNSNAEYRSVLATIDSTVLEIKKQSISKYGFQDNNPMNYNLVCSTGFYTDNKGKTVPAATEGFGTLSDTWNEVNAEYLVDLSRPLDIRNILEDMDSTRLELRHKDPAVLTLQDTVTMKEAVRRSSSGLHHYPGECPFLILIKGYDRTLDHVIYPLSEGETVFLSSGHPTSPTSRGGHIIVIHTTETINCSITRLGSKCTMNKDTRREPLKCGKSFYVGKHYKFLYREAIDNDVLSSGVGSPDTQRTLSTGTLISLSPELNSMNTVVHQHAEPRFIFYMEHKEILLDSILNYTVLSHRNMLACAQLSIMTLRHVFDNFATSEVQEILHYCKEKLEELAKVVQQKASELLSSPHKKSACDFLKPMLKLLSSTLEIVHFLKERKMPVYDEIVEDIEKLAVPMYEHVAFHTTKMVYEFLPCILDPFQENETLLSAVEEPDDSAIDDSSSTASPRVSSESCPSPCVTGETASPSSPRVSRGSCPNAMYPTSTAAGSEDKRRWSVPGLGPVRKRKMPKRDPCRPRSESMCVVNENSQSLAPNAAFRWSADEIRDLTNRNGGRCSNGSVSPGYRRNTTKHSLTNIGTGVKKLVQLLQKIHVLGYNCKLNDAMVKQLFVSIFFFSNTTLFNTIMESPQQYFSWHKGIQIRVHLDYVLRWAHQSNLADESSTYFKSLNQLLDLLSLPKRDLLGSSWSALTRTFPDLTPTQLNHVLSNYCTSQKPKIWKPTPSLSMVNDNCIRIELTAYPALVIPTRGYKLGTFSEIPDNLRSLLSKLTRTVVANGASPLGDRTIVCELQKSDSKPIGLKLKKTSSGRIVVNDIVSNSPAHKSGVIECHDEVLQINQNNVTGTNVALCKKLIQDSEKFVQITICRGRT